MSTKKKYIYLKAYFRNNLGDDMFVRYIAEKYPDVIFKICTSSTYAQPFVKQTNIKNIPSWGYFADRVSNKFIGKQICKQYIETNAQATVHIGGSIFIEPENFTFSQKVSSNSNLFIIGCNFGPYKTREYRDFIFSRLQKATDVCFRDRYSYEEFSELKHARVAPDILFGYPNYPNIKKGVGVGISVIDPAVRSDLKHIADSYYLIMAKMIDHYAKNGVSVKLFVFCKDEGDGNAVSEIMKRCETHEAEICEYNGDIDAMLDQLNSCEYIVASRFHAMIIGWCLSKKVFPVIYSNKQLHVIDDVNYPGPYWDLREKLECTADSIIYDMYKAKSFDVDEYRWNSKQHFDKFDDYLKKSILI